MHPHAHILACACTCTHDPHKRGTHAVPMSSSHRTGTARPTPARCSAQRGSRSGTHVAAWLRARRCVSHVPPSAPPLPRLRRRLRARGPRRQLHGDLGDGGERDARLGDEWRHRLGRSRPVRPPQTLVRRPRHGHRSASRVVRVHDNQRLRLGWHRECTRGVRCPAQHNDGRGEWRQWPRRVCRGAQPRAQWRRGWESYDRRRFEVVHVDGRWELEWQGPPGGRAPTPAWRRRPSGRALPPPRPPPGRRCGGLVVTLRGEDHTGALALHHPGRARRGRLPSFPWRSFGFFGFTVVRRTNRSSKW